MSDKVFNGSAKAYAVSKGIGQAGRGRPSREQLDCIAAARAEGWTFTAESGKTVSVGTDEKPAIKIITGKDLRQGAARTSPEGSVWIGDLDGKPVKVSGKAVCSPCGVSLTYHTCNAPRAVVGSGVIVPLSIRE